MFSKLLPQALARRAERAREGRSPSRAQRRATLGIFGVVVVLSIAPIWNLVSSEQAMNRSFEPLGLVNTYGAFGSVGRVRSELVIEGTLDASLGPTTVWREYEFRAKPGDPLRRPPWLTPYHRRLDWLMWFAAMGSPQEYPFVVQLLAKLLEGDANVRTLLARDPFDGRAPEYVRVWCIATSSSRRCRRSPATFVALGGTWLPPLSKSDPRLREFLFVHGFRADGIDPTSIESR
ncbi:MAG: lipase maturation factor family protein [Polyangiaceae bacterium]